MTETRVRETGRRLKLAWLSLATALALHVADEASHDFLAWYNPIAHGIRRGLGGFPFPPEFSFRMWLSGLVALVVLATAITPLVDGRRRWVLVIATAWGVIHVANGLLHIVSSFAIGQLTPGTVTAPLLLVAAPWLLIEVYHSA